MIKYKLICKSCDISFDSWFASSHEYEKLKERKLLNCLQCSSKMFEKRSLKLKRINKKIKEYQNFIKNNFEYVGENFTYEARSIHYNNKKRKKGIFGTASKDDIKELKDEGIQTDIIPWMEDKNN